MEISTEKNKIIANIHAKYINNDITVNSTTLEHVNQFTCLGYLVIDNGF